MRSLIPFAFTLLLALYCFQSIAQQGVINNQSNIYITNGTGLYVTGTGADIHNNSTSVIEANGTIDIDGDFNNSGTTNLNGSTFNIGGDWTNGGTFSEGTSTVHFNGGVSQHVDHNGAAFYNISVSTGGGNALELNSAFEVKNLMTLLSGMVYTNGDTIILDSLAMFTGEANGQFIAGFVAALCNVTGATADDFGNVGVTITPAGQNLGETWVLRVTGLNAQDTSYAVNPSDNNKKSIDRIFHIFPTTQPSGDITLTLEWLSDNDNGLASFSDAQVWKSNDGTTWVAVGPQQDASSRTISVATDALSSWTVSNAANPLDDTPPTTICQDATLQLSTTGNATLTTGDIDNGSSDASGIASMSLSQTSFNCSHVSAPTVVTLTVFDNAGNSATCNGTVSVEDNIAPIASCQDVTVQLDTVGQAIITTSDIDNGSTDNCNLSSKVLDKAVFSCSDTSNNIVQLTITDVSSNTSICTATVTVYDTIAPVAACNDLTIYLDGAGMASITTADADNGSADNCETNFSLSQESFGFPDLGDNNETLTVTDNSGNITTCLTIVTVSDTTGPNALCQDVTLQLSPTGNATLTTNDIDNGSSDDDGIASMTLSQTNFNCSHIAGPNVVVLTVFDNSGNSSTCSGTVTIADTLNPIASCQNVTVHLDTAGQALVTASEIDDGSADNCGILTEMLDRVVFSCIHVGNNTVQLTLTDVNSNVSTCSATVTVYDTIVPVAACKDLTIYLDGSGNGLVNAGQIDGGGNTVILPDAIDHGSLDACGLTSLTTDIQQVDCDDVGTFSVVLTATDVNSNSDTCSATVTLLDTVSPIAVCKDLTLSLDSMGAVAVDAGTVNGAGQAVTNASTTDDGSLDACGLDSLYIDQTMFDCSNLGDHTLTHTVVDMNGNSSECEAVVTITDDLAPVPLCQDLTVQLDTSGQAAIVAGAIDGSGNALVVPGGIDNMSYDNCALDTLVIDKSEFGCADIGNNIVLLTVTDVNANSSTCEGIVTVEDTIPPTAMCMDATLYLDASGNAVLGASDVENGSSDVCGIANVSLSQENFDCSHAGTETVIVTVTDAGGNLSTCNADININDTLPPQIVCPADISLTVFTACDTSVSWTPPIPTDNCATSPTLSSSHNPGDNFAIGLTTVTYIATDDAGNSVQCSFDVTIIDPNPPVISGCPGDIDNGCSNIIAWPEPTATDDCNLTGFDRDPPLGTLFTAGITTVTYTATDGSGNTTECSFTVTNKPLPVADAGADLSICPGDTIQVGGAPTGSGGIGLSYTYVWAGGNGTLSTTSESNPLAFPSVTSSYLVFVIDNTTGCAATDHVIVSVDEIPTAGLGADSHVKMSVDSSAATAAFLADTLNIKDWFGFSAAALGGISPNGAIDLAIGAHLNDDDQKDGGNVYIVSMDAAGNVVNLKTPFTNTTMTDMKVKKDYFGYGLGNAGDINGDGIPEIAVGSLLDEVTNPDNDKDEGTVKLFFVDSNFNITNEVTIADGSPSSPTLAGTLNKKAGFGSDIASIGDLNGDGVDDLAVGAYLYDGILKDFGAVFILFMNADGTVANHNIISDATFTVDETTKKDRFGTAVVSPGDINGNGIRDIVVGAPNDDVIGGGDRGAIYVLFMNTDGTVVSYQKVGMSTQTIGLGGFTGTLKNKDWFGFSLAEAGDINKDGIPEVIVGAPLDDDGVGGDLGAFYILFFNSDGTVNFYNKISREFGGFKGGLDTKDYMGSSLVFLDDLDGNCQPAIFAGAYGDDADTGPLAGKKDIGGGWVIYLDDFNDVEKIPGTTNELSEYRPLAIPFASASQNNLTGEEGTFINAMSEVSVNPNPTEGVLYWQIDATEKNDVLVEMFDLLGNKVFKWEGIVENKHQQKADFSSLAAGQYLMKFVVGKQNITRVISVLN